MTIVQEPKDPSLLHADMNYLKGQMENAFGHLLKNPDWIRQGDALKSEGMKELKSHRELHDLIRQGKYYELHPEQEKPNIFQQPEIKQDLQHLFFIPDKSISQFKPDVQTKDQLFSTFKHMMAEESPFLQQNDNFTSWIETH